MRQWTFTESDARNPHNGRITDERDILIVLRAVMNDDDRKIMRLIAAAPDLLAALQRCVQLMQPSDVPVIAEQAIAKATGQC